MDHTDDKSKQTEVKLEISKNPDMHIFFDKGLTEGISMVANPFAKANNPDVKGLSLIHI